MVYNENGDLLIVYAYFNNVLIRIDCYDPSTKSVADVIDKFDTSFMQALLNNKTATAAVDILSKAVEAAEPFGVKK